MGINDQAKADVQMQGQDDASQSGRNEDSPNGGDDQAQVTEPTFDDVNDIDSWNRAMGQLEGGDMPDINPEPTSEEIEADVNSGEGAEASEESESEVSESESEEESEEESSEKGEESEEESEESESEEESEESESEASEEEEEEQEDEPERSTSKRFRLRSDDPVEQRAMELKRRNKDMTLKEALSRAETELGVNDQSDESGDDADSDTGSLPKTVKDAETEIERLLQERSKAIREDLDFDKGDEIDTEIRKLERHIGDLKLGEIKSESQTRAQFNEKLDQSKAKAVELYDFVTKDGPEIARMEEIDQILKDSGDPLYDSPDKPLRLAQMVAREMGIAPKGKTVKKPAVVKPGQPPRKKSPVQPASASARTAPTSSKGQLDERIESINDPLDWEAAMGEM